MAFSKREAPNCSLCPFQKNCFYDLLEDKKSKEAWRQIRVANRFKAGDTLFYEGEKPYGVYVVCSGRVKVNKTSRTGQQLLMRIEHPGDLVGHISWLSGWNYGGATEAMEDCVVSMVETKAMEDFLVRHPKSALALLREVARDVRRGEARARDIAFQPAKSRLAGTLIRMSKPMKDKKILVASLKRKELAEMSGLTIETTVRLIKQFENQGLLKKQGRDLHLINPDRLKFLTGNLN